MQGSAGFALGDKLLIAVEPGIVRSLDPSTRKPREGREAKIPSGKVRIKLVADGSVVDVYADDVWLFAEHCPRPNPDQARIISLGGAARASAAGASIPDRRDIPIRRDKSAVTDLRLDRLFTGNPVHDYGFNY